MLSLPDFREKQIVYLISKPGANQKLQFWNDNIRLLENDKPVCVQRTGSPVNQISCSRVFAVFIIGDFSITTKLIKNCKEYGISLFLLKQNFEVYAAVIAEAEGNYLLRTKQYSLKNEFEIAKNIVKNKVYNQLQLLNEAGKIAKPMSAYKQAALTIDSTKEHKSLLGLEGNYTRGFFQQYFKEFDWVRRSPRTKGDITNVLMDIGYTFLFNFTDALLRLYGFDTYKGIYHKLFFKRKSLACDVMEPFRFIIDKQIYKAYRLKQIDRKDFAVSRGQYQLSYQNQQKYLELFFESIMERKENLFVYTRDFYYCILNDTTAYPFFKING